MLLLLFSAASGGRHLLLLLSEIWASAGCRITVAAGISGGGRCDTELLLFLIAG